MSIVARADGAWRLIDCKESSGVYVRDAGEWISLCPDEVLPPFELITGYTIDHVGTSASLVGGQVQFDGVTSLSLNDVFSSEYRNYVVSMLHEGSAGYPVYARLRASGSDATASNYTWQYILASATTVNAMRSVDSYWHAADAATAKGGVTISIYGPALAQPTAFRKVDNYPASGATIIDAASTHSLSTSYDGFSLIMFGGRTITGALQVYGVRS